MNPKPLPAQREQFEQFVKARGAERLSLEQAISQMDPGILVQIALDSFQERGNQDRLLDAAMFLERHPASVALPILAHMARTAISECEYFMGSLLSAAQDKESHDTLRGILYLLIAHDESACRSVVDMAYELPPELRHEIFSKFVDRSESDTLAYQCVKLTTEGKFTKAWEAAGKWQALRDGKES